MGNLSCGVRRAPPRLTCADIALAPAASGSAFVGERGRRGVAARERTAGRVRPQESFFQPAMPQIRQVLCIQRALDA